MKGHYADHSGRAVFARSNTGVMGSNPTWSMDVYVRLFCRYAILCVCSGLETGWSPVQEFIPTMYKFINRKSVQGQKKFVQP
jgi:hypothetical protein